MASPSAAAPNPMAVCGFTASNPAAIPPAVSLPDRSDSAAPAVSAKPNVANCPSSRLRTKGSLPTTRAATSGHGIRRFPTSCQVQLMPSTVAMTAREAQSVAAAGSGSAPNGARAKPVQGG